MNKRNIRRLRVVAWILSAFIGISILCAHAGRRYILSAYPLTYTEAILQMSDTYGVTPSLIAAVIRTESRFDPLAVSHAGAVGLMQLTPQTFDWAQARAGVKDALGKEALTDPTVNIQYGTVTLSLLYDMFEDETAALAAYNAGQGTVKKWLTEEQYSSDGVHLTAIPYTETAQYVKRVKTAQTIYRKFYDLP